MPIDAVLLAGRLNEGLLRVVSDETWEAMVPVGGLPMAAWVGLAALEAPSVGRLAVVGPEELMAHLPSERVLRVPPGRHMFENLLRGTDALQPEGRVLVLTSDIPLVRSRMVEDFVREALDADADFCYPIVSRERVEATFGQSRRTYVSVKEGTFTGGNLILVRPEQMRRLADEAGALIALRKRPLGLARRLGVGFLLRFLLFRPPLQDVERHFSRLFGLTARAIPVPHAEIGVDVDRPEDLILCQKILLAS